MRELVVETLGIRGFRNLGSVDIEFGARFNVIAGDNGQGKTNLLEGLYVLATSKSFRTAKPVDLIAAGGETASLRAGIREAAERREQSLGIRGGTRAVRVDGKRPPTFAAYAVRTPAVVFHPGAVALASGAGAERRKLLDRVALYLSPDSLVESKNFVRAARARQRVLELRGEGAADLDGWEELFVQHGLALIRARARAADLLGPAAERAFVRIGDSASSLRATYCPGAPSSPGAFRAELVRHRVRDRARRSASVGPHRDDFLLELGGMPVRGMASQGQQRAVVLAVELAEIEVIAAARGVRPILLLDDVSSELDRARTRALLAALREEQGQVFITTTRPELIELVVAGEPRGAVQRRDFRVVKGAIARE